MKTYLKTIFFCLFAASCGKPEVTTETKDLVIDEPQFMIGVAKLNWVSTTNGTTVKNISLTYMLDLKNKKIDINYLEPIGQPDYQLDVAYEAYNSGSQKSWIANIGDKQQLRIKFEETSPMPVIEFALNRFDAPPVGTSTLYEDSSKTNFFEYVVTEKEADNMLYNHVTNNFESKKIYNSVDVVDNYELNKYYKFERNFVDDLQVNSKTLRNIPIKMNWGWDCSYNAFESDDKYLTAKLTRRVAMESNTCKLKQEISFQGRKSFLANVMIEDKTITWQQYKLTSDLRIESDGSFAHPHFYYKPNSREEVRKHLILRATKYCEDRGRMYMSDFTFNRVQDYKLGDYYIGEYVIGLPGGDVARGVTIDFAGTSNKMETYSYSCSHILD